jgi:pimeloyl-ACP methyl ester carboxylesterase
MAIFSELRYPTRWYSKLLVVVVAVAFFASLFTAAISVYLLYRILSPTVTREELGSTDFPGHPEDFLFSVPDGQERSGWFFPGLRGVPTIVLCHPYGSNRGELLTLATSLQDRQYNVFLFDFAGHGESKGQTTLGFEEAGELEAALNAISKRDDVDPMRFGLWGSNLGGYAALITAEHDPRVRSMVVESVYDTPEDFLRAQIAHFGLARLSFIERLTVAEFDWKERAIRNVPPVSANMAPLGGDFKLFLEAQDEPMLARDTQEIYLRAPDPKQRAEITVGNYARMLDDAKRVYENRILSFFLVNLPPNSHPRH